MRPLTSKTQPGPKTDPVPESGPPMRRSADIVPTCMADLHEILFEGHAPSESRVEGLIDRIEGRTR